MRVRDDSSDTVFEQLIRREVVEAGRFRLILTVLGLAYGDRCGRAFVAGTKKLILLAPNIIQRADRSYSVLFYSGEPSDFLPDDGKNPGDHARRIYHGAGIGGEGFVGTLREWL